MVEYVINLYLTPAQIQQLRENLKNGRPFLNKLGELVLEAGQEAFKNQSYDGKQWLARYPNQRSNFVNLAGAVEDLDSGPFIDPKRFTNRPVGINTSNLKNSLTPGRAFDFRVNSLKITAHTPYAEKFHAGGKSKQILTSIMKSNLRKWIKDNPGHPATTRLQGLLTKSILETESPARPYLDLTTNIANDFAKWFETNCYRSL